MDRAIQKNGGFWGYATIALCLHASVLVYFNLLGGISQNVLELKERVIELVDPTDLSQNRKPVVQTSKALNQIQSDKEAQYAGEFDQRVEQETRSPLVGSFQEGQIGGFKKELELGEGEKSEGAASGPTLKEFMTFGRSPHALSEQLPLGNQTVLNTDKVRYASFINRIADEIYHPWVEAAERAVRDFVVERRKIEPNLYVTRLRITLDQEGAVQGIQVLSSSGIRELDEAPKKALWETEPFPNPPTQLFESDGFVRLTYEFQFEWKNSAFNIIPWKI